MWPDWISNLVPLTLQSDTLPTCSAVSFLMAYGTLGLDTFLLFSLLSGIPTFLLSKVIHTKLYSPPNEYAIVTINIGINMTSKQSRLLIYLPPAGTSRGTRAFPSGTVVMVCHDH